MKAGTTKAKNTRNNIQIVLRSVLRFGSKHGYLAEVPGALPQLNRGGDLIPDIPNDHQVARILELSSPSQRRAFLLMAYAGLRPNEVRALENRSVRLNSNKAEPESGFIWVREGESYGERHSPKTGQRQIPIGGPLLAELIEATGSRETCVALTAQGRPWAQSGLHQAFLRACSRAKIEGFTVYSLRHYAITLWLRAGCRCTWCNEWPATSTSPLPRATFTCCAAISTKPPCALATCSQQRHPPLPLCYLRTQPNPL
jgi:integrase